MAKSDHGVRASSRGTQQLVSQEEYDLRFVFMAKENKSLEDWVVFQEAIESIRERTGRP